MQPNFNNDYKIHFINDRISRTDKRFHAKEIVDFPKQIASHNLDFSISQTTWDS